MNQTSNMKKKKIITKINNKDKIINKRIVILSIFVLLSFSIIIIYFCYLNIYMGSYYKMILENKTANIVSSASVPRGRIYDRNGKLLVDNIPVKIITYKRIKDISLEEEIKLAYFLSEKIELDYEELFERNLKEFYILLYPNIANEKITNEEYKKYNNRQLSFKELEEFKIERITSLELESLNKEDKRAAYLYYLMNKGYYYDEKIIKKANVTEKEYAYILENISVLKGFNINIDWERKYLYGDVIRGILGKVSDQEMGIPKEELEYYLSLGYKRNDRVGVSGIEKQYESILKGEKALYKVLDDNSLKLIKEGQKGLDIVLSIDIDLQIEIEEMLEEEIIKTKKEANTEFYDRSFIVIENPKTGEIMAMVGKQIDLSSNNKNPKFYDFAEGAMLYAITPGSVVKGASITTGYNAGVIKIGTIIEDKCIKFLNMPEKCSWRRLGTINDITALASSSNVYQFKIAMMIANYDYYYNKELDLDLNTFDIYRNTFYQYGLGVKTGIDYPNEIEGYKGSGDYGDLLLNFTIGQYDTYTPLQLAQYVSTIANDGNRVKTRFLKSIITNNNEIIDITPVILNKVELEKKYMDRIKEGFIATMTRGTGVNYMGITKYPAGKTGTSESFVDINGDGIVDYESISNNFVGYAPYNDPIMAISVSSPNVQNPARGRYRSNVNYRISKRASSIFFTLYNKNGKRIS